MPESLQALMNKPYTDELLREKDSEQISVLLIHGDYKVQLQDALTEHMPAGDDISKDDS